MTASVLNGLTVALPAGTASSQGAGLNAEWLAAIALTALAFAGGAAIQRKLPRVSFPSVPRPFLLLVPLTAALVLQAIIGSVAPPRAPRVHDEFSYLLQADTFLRGRFANPPHPMWEFFDSPHVNFQPTYSSMYPPLQGAILAAGKLLTGHPLAGPALVSATLGAVLAWAMLPLLPAGWAVFGGTLAAIRIGAFSYWANSFWGAAHVAVGGALMLGAAARLLERVRTRDAFLFGLGVVVCVSSRPFEGALLSGLFGLFLGTKLWGRRSALLPPALVLLAVLATGAAVNMAYYRATTGHPLILGYQINCARHRLPVMAWERGGESPTHAPNSKRFYAESLRLHDVWTADAMTIAIRPLAKALTLWQFFIGPLLAVPLLFTFRRTLRELGWPLGIAAAFLAVSAVNVWSMPHYLAPITAILVLVLTAAVKLLSESMPMGRIYAAGLPFACLAVGFHSLVAAPEWTPMPGEFRLGWHLTTQGNPLRAEVENRIGSLPDKHLILMRYPAEHEATEEWAYNGAEIDSSPIVWAHDLGPERNRELLAYYPDRRVWLVEPHRNRAQISPYKR